MDIYNTACQIVKRLQDKGYIAYFAGGWVRDFLMDVESNDIDIATDATTQDVQKLFAKTIPVGVQFGIIVVVENGHQFEIATFRKDHGYEDGRRPLGFDHAAPKEDAERRDFTINGIFYDPLNKKLIDYVEGQKDIKNRIIRAIGHAELRFTEDKLRMIRALRYACRFEFSIEKNTLAAIETQASTLFPAVAIERVWQEFKKLAKFGCFADFLLRLYKTKLLHEIFPKIANLTEGELQERLLRIKHHPQNTPLIIKILELLDIRQEDDTQKLCDYLKLSNKDKGRSLYFLKASKCFEDAKGASFFTWAHLHAHRDFHNCLEVFLTRLSENKRLELIKEQETLKNKLSSYIQRIRDKTPLVTSTTLVNEGVPPGKGMGDLLKEAEKISINEQIESADEVISILKKTPLWP